MAQNKSSNNNFLYSIFSHFRTGPTQLVVGITVIVSVIFLTLSVPLLTLYINYNKNLNELISNEKMAEIQLTENVILSLQEALYSSNEKIHMLETENVKLGLEIQRLNDNIKHLEVVIELLFEEDIALSSENQDNFRAQDNRVLEPVE